MADFNSKGLYGIYVKDELWDTTSRLYSSLLLTFAKIFDIIYIENKKSSYYLITI